MPVLPPLDPPPSAPARQRRYVDIRHPAYPQSEQPLLRFGAIDGDNKDGVDFDIALVASGIITGNTWPSGYLAQKDDGGNFVKVDRFGSDILQGHEYYYFVDEHEPDYKYPVIPSFDHWRFPHGNLPAIWEEINIPPAPRLPSLKKKIAALARDTTCRISRYGGAIEVAHFVPMADEKWFLSNTMDRYGASGSDPQPIDDPSNLITLRRDLHHLFDTRRFTFVPKRDIADKARCLALHVFSPDENNELVPLYHNRSPAPLSGISIEHVFARFAWTIFSDQTVRFFKGMAEYLVLLFDPKTDEIKEAKLRALDVRTQVKIFDASPKSRSASPRKRQRDPSAQDDEFWVVEEEGDASISADWESPRGRRRKRSWDYFAGDTPPELVQSFLSTESDRSESQDAAMKKVKVEVVPHDSPDAAAIQRYPVPRKLTHDGMADRSCKRIDTESAKG